jgi:DNA-binding transcriptional LysR family regulator
MHQANSLRADLNLLAVFDAVAETRSVTLAAERLSLSQPAVSHALNRLRDVLQDPLFVRSRSGFVPTPRAKALISTVRDILDASDRVFRPAVFDPATSTQAFKIAASDYAMMTIMPGLVRALRSQAPAAALEICPAGGPILAQLESGEVDASFWGAELPAPPYRSHVLFRERFIGLVCARHPMAVKAGQGALDLDDYLAYPHVMVSFRDPRQSPIDTRLGEIGRDRKKGVITPNFAANVAALAGTDLIMSLPSRLAARIDPQALIAFNLPIDVPDYSYSLVWHRRTETDPALVWLRSLVLDKAVEPAS